MKDSELYELLKRTRIPARDPRLWEELPKRIVARLQWRRVPEAARSGERRFLRAAWAVLGAGVGLGIAVWLLPLRDGDLRNRTRILRPVEKCFLEIESLFPNQVKAVVFDERGARLILADAADMPNSQPLYLRICGPNGCQEIVTFSGQRIWVNGDQCEVLMNAAGRVVLVGERLVWSGESAAAGAYRIKARALEGSS